jgi:UDP-GlcNAc:undecaprenyl-phosphate GlcNAc-1-phosphate transferase
LFLLHISVPFLIAFAFVAIATPFVRKYALRWKLGAKPNGRKVCANTIPHVGGIGMAVATLLSVAIAGLFFDRPDGGTLTLLARFLLPVVLIVALGIADDTKNLKAGQKLTIQIFSAVILVLSGVQLLVGLPIFDHSSLFVLFLTTFYLVGISSSVNLVDGMDGVAAGLSLISAATFGVLAFLLGAQPLVFVSLALVGACGGFLIYNFPPGRIYMGDTGSMFLGVMLGIIACSFTMLQPSINTFFGVGLILAIPMLDSFLAIVRRLVLRRPVFQADSLHMHHILSLFGCSARQTLAILYSMQAVMAILGVLTVQGLILPLVLGVVLLVLVFLSFIRIMVASKERTEILTARFAPSSVPSLEK